MIGNRLPLLALCGELLLCIAVSSPLNFAADQDSAKRTGSISGILVAMNNNSIDVKVDDGGENPVRYYFDNDSDKALLDALKTVSGICRVRLTCREDGNTLRLTSVAREASPATGTVTGLVVRTYGWWIEVKPADGPPDGYLVQYPFAKHKTMVDKVKAMRPGDTVAIQFTTDREGHRIESLERTAPAKQ
jgi:hypothetical protein